MDMDTYRGIDLQPFERFRKECPARMEDGLWVHDLLPGETFPATWRGRGDAEFRAYWRRRDELKAQAAASCANWLREGQPVEVIWDKGRLDGRNWEGRRGFVHRLCTGCFPEYCYVFFPKRGRERTDKVEMMHILALAPREAQDEAPRQLEAA